MGTKSAGALRRTLDAAELLGRLFTGAASRERLCVLFMLTSQCAQPCALCSRMGVDKRLINKYLQRLQGAGLVRRRRFGSGVCYTLSSSVGITVHAGHLRVTLTAGGRPDAAHRRHVFQVLRYSFEEARELGLGPLVDALIAAEAAQAAANDQPAKPAVTEAGAVLEPKARVPKASRPPTGPERT